MNKYTLAYLPLICATMASLHADVARTNQQATREIERFSVNMNEITPPALPCVKRWADPYLTTDYIYWKAEQEGLEYASTGIKDGGSTSSVSKSGSVHKPDFEYSSGFRVGFGLKFRHDSWDFYANYTWLQSNDGKNHADRKNNQALMGLWYVPELDEIYVLNASEASSKWTMHFNVLDLELGRNYYISPRLTLRPHFGLKLAWIKQKVSTSYSDASSYGTNLGNGDWSFNFKQTQNGVGIRAGLNTAWYLYKTLSIFGNFAASGVYNDFQDNQRITRRATNNVKRRFAKIKSHTHPVTPVLEFALGLRYEYNFYNNNYQWMLQFGWDAQVWFDQNQFTNFSDDRSGNLTMQGLTVKTGFSF